MVIDLKNSTTKEFIQRAEIQTMKKDLKRLREYDAAKESEKIISAPLKAPTSAPLPPAPKMPEPTLKQPSAQPAPKILTLPNSASELEKQQHFALGGQKHDLQAQLEFIRYEQKTALAMEKTKLMAEKERLQEKLSQLSQKEYKQPENKKESVEKQVWAIEKEIQSKERQLQEIDKKIAGLGEQEKALSEKIAGIESSESNILAQVKSRNEQALKEPQKKEYLQQPPASIKEKLSVIAKAEEALRRKFMEDIEKWVQSTKK